jgi:hypothetical protein
MVLAVVERNRNPPELSKLFESAERAFSLGA